jgi:hypothetical protein
MYLQKNLKKHLSNDLAIGLYNFVNVANRGNDSHICQSLPRLASRPSREIHRPRAWSHDYSLLPLSNFLFGQVINAKQLEIVSFHFLPYLFGIW